MNSVLKNFDSIRVSAFSKKKKSLRGSVSNKRFIQNRLFFDGRHDYLERSGWWRQLCWHSRTQLTTITSLRKSISLGLRLQTHYFSLECLVLISLVRLQYYFKLLRKTIGMNNYLNITYLNPNFRMNIE